MRVACIGEAMIELSMAGNSKAVVGVAGDTLNTAIYLKRMSPMFEVDYITRLGTDAFSAQIKTFVANQDIGTDQIETSPDRSPGLYAITTTPNGERSFTYWRDQSAARQLFQTDTSPRFEALDGYDCLYLSGITLAIIPDSIRMALLAYLSGSHHSVAFDSNYRPRLWPDKARAQQVISAFWQRADIALPSLDDEMLLTNATGAQVTQRFLNSACQGALKRGDQGPISLSEPINQPYPTAPKVVDTTAAGDSFNGAYLAALWAGAPQQKALLAGHECAAFVVQHRGAIAPVQGAKLNAAAT